MKPNQALQEAYLQGRLEGRSEAQRLLNCCVQTNRTLWDTMLKLDESHPANGTSVRISLLFAERLVGFLREHGNNRYAAKLGKAVKQSQQSTRQLLDKLERLQRNLDTGADK